ncbi:MAG TPA: ATP phosphoribosyltransferase [Acidimicrobiia bacterium]|jgi:ATP phosphoribosyltransferase|nr:ATP phosphoribosyltransferase [Acidimicrobiia bacterium]
MSSNDQIHLAVPKGRIQQGVFDLLADAGMQLQAGTRGYRPTLSISGYEVKLLKPQNIVEMLMAGSRDIGFAGADWVSELDGDLVELLDTGLDPVRIVAAAPSELLESGQLPRRQLVVASEYEQLTRRWIADNGLDAVFVRSYGATEVFPPEDADVIIDNTATGSTLAANGLEVIDELMQSSTRLYASKGALDRPGAKTKIESLVISLKSVLDARTRAMIELNVAGEFLEAVIEILPRMREPTIASLHGDSGLAVKAAVPRLALPDLIPLLKERGATDIVVSRLEQIVP